MMYQQSQGHRAPQGKRFESNFNLHLHSANGDGCSHDVPPGPSNSMIPLPPEDPANTENRLLEYTANDVFGDFD